MKSLSKFLGTLMILWITASLFSLSCSIPVSAITTHTASYAQAGYTGSEIDVFAPEPGAGVRRLDMTAPWDFLGDAMHVKRHIRNGSCTAYAILDTDECAGETTFTLEMADDLSAYSVLCFGVGFTSGTWTPSPIRAELELTDYSGNRAVSQVDLAMPGEDFTGESIWWNLLCFDISAFEGRNDTTLLTITLTYDPSAPPNVLRLTNPYAAAEDDGGFAYAKRYLTNSLTAETGVFAMRSGASRPDDRGQVRLSGSFVLAEQPEIGSEAFLEITLSRVQSGGLTAAIGYENGEIAYIGRVSLPSDGDHSGETFTLPIDVSDRLQTFELTFDSIVCDTYFKVDSIRLHYDNHTEISGNSDLGKVTSLTYAGNSVMFSGVMQRDAIREYSGAELRFFAIPGWTSSDLSTAVEIGQTKLSTRFEYTADLSAYPYLAATYRFFAGLVTEDGEILPISAPTYPNAAEISEQVLSNVGLYDAAAVGVFESNASHVIVDVLLNRLLTDPQTKKGDASSLSYTVYRTEPDSSGERNEITMQINKTPVDHTYLQELDSEINFYISAGLEVYLRIMSDTAIPGLTYEEPGAEQYAVCPDSPEARNFYAATVRYLCRRYSGIGGLVVGSAVNLGRQTGGGVDDENAAAYAHELAELCRITYTTAASEIPDILIILPFAMRPDEETENEPFRCVDPKTLTVMMVSYLETMGSVPWVMMYCAEEIAEILSVDLLSADLLAGETTYSDGNSAAQRIKQLIDELALDGSAAIMYYYEPTYEATLAGFRNTSGLSGYSEYLAELFAKLCGSTRARAVFLSLHHLNARLEHEFYSFLKTSESIPDTVIGAGSKPRSVLDYTALPLDAAADKLAHTVSQTAVWDFSDKFYPLGWIAGGGVSSCLTVYSDLFSESDAERYTRVLRSTIAVDEESASYAHTGMAAGISLRNLTRTVDLSEVDYLEFTFALNHPGYVMGTGHESGTVVFLLGSDDRRAEFKVETAIPERVLTYVCDLSDYEFRDQVDFMGIMVYADHNVYLDLASVRAYSNTLSHGELEAVFAPDPPAEDVPVDYEAVMVVSVIVFVLSVSAAVLLIRHDAEERRERLKQRRLSAERHSRRERIRR